MASKSSSSFTCIDRLDFMTFNNVVLHVYTFAGTSHEVLYELAVKLSSSTIHPQARLGQEAKEYTGVILYRGLQVRSILCRITCLPRRPADQKSSCWDKSSSKQSLSSRFPYFQPCLLTPYATVPKNHGNLSARTVTLSPPNRPTVPPSLTNARPAHLTAWSPPTAHSTPRV